MKINLDNKQLDLCNRYLYVKEMNMSSAEFYISYLTYYPRSIKQADIDRYIKSYSIEKSFYLAMKEKMDIPCDDDEFIEIDKITNIKNIQKLSKDKYLNNEFYKSIPFAKQKNNDWELSILSYLPFEGFVYDELDIDPNNYYSEHTPLGFFDKEFPFLAVIQKDEIWMSVIPHEINTMKKPIQNAFGNVLVLGLGIGYYQFMIALKEEVKSITIIESDKNAIKIFNECIYPFVKNKDKIHIINDDAFEFLKNNDLNKFDYIFSDIWHNASDGLPLYLKIKKYEKLYPNTKFDYWIETSLLALLRRYVLTVFEEQLDGSTVDDYLNAINENDVIVNKLYFLLIDYEINNEDDLKQLLSDKSLKDIATKLDY